MSANILNGFWAGEPVNRERIIKVAKWWGVAHCSEKKTNLSYKPGDAYGWCKTHKRFEKLTESHYWNTPHCPDDGTNLGYSPGATEAACTHCGQPLSLVEVKWSGQVK